MKRPAAFAVAAAIAAGSSLGCGSTGSPGPTGPSDPAVYLAAYDQAACALRARCGLIAPSSVAACAAASEASQTYDVAAAVKAGRLAYDASAAGKCLAETNQQACNENAGPDCAKVLLPEVAAGSVCQADMDCIGGYCAGSKMPGCTGTCQRTLAAGQTCSDPAQCGPGDVCDLGNTNTCVAAPALLPAGGTCGDNTQCQASLLCVLATVDSAGNEGTCQPPGKMGAACSTTIVAYNAPDDTCATGLACVPTKYLSDSSGGFYPPYAVGTCQPIGDTGGSCQTPDGCPSGETCAGWQLMGNAPFILTPGFCTPWLDANAKCDPAPVATGCTYDGYCDCSTRKCVDPSPAGAACGMLGCQPGLYCKGSTCAPEIPLGGSCAGGAPCAAGTCTGGTCALVCM